MDKIIEAILKFLPFGKLFEFIGCSKEVSASLSALLSTVVLYFIALWVKRWQEHSKNLKTANDLAPYFDYQKVKQAQKHFIPSRFQNFSPTVEEEPGFSHKFVAKQKLIPFFIHTVFNEKMDKEGDKFYLILADSGMGKTTFMINLYIKYNSRFGKNYKIKLIPFGDHRIIDNLKELAKKPDEVKNTILLLDAFDEYKGLLPPEITDGLSDDLRFRKRLDEIVELARDFREVIITSRTQYFPGQENQAYELKIPRFDDKGFHTLAKLYLSPFDEKEIKCFLNKKFGALRFWNMEKKRKAAEIVKSSPKLMVRPMLLSYIDYLVESDQKFENTYQIYEALINKWIDREGNKREHLHTNREKLKQNLHKYSQMVAVKIYEKRKQTNSLQLSKADATDVNVELKDYQMTGQSLLTRDLENNWKFAHKSILEFFLAKEAAENIDFAMKLDLSGMDMTKIFCSEIGISSIILSNYSDIKGNKFLMGSPKEEIGRREDETPHWVELSDFSLCKYAVTVADFKAFMDDKKDYQTDAENDGGSYMWTGKKYEKKEGINWRYGVSGKLREPSEYNHPVVHVSWNDAMAYIAWLNTKTDGKFRLATEAEWEYACRAGTARPFSTGENLSTDQANYNGNFPYNKIKKGEFRQNTVSVDSFLPNAYGLYNMHGNVFEWCYDWYGSYSSTSQTDPTGATSGSRRVGRGGGWSGTADGCRLASRGYNTQGFRFSGLGFRLARAL